MSTILVRPGAQRGFGGLAVHGALVDPDDERAVVLAAHSGPDGDPHGVSGPAT
jgi:hypothetical protein